MGENDGFQDTLDTCRTVMIPKITTRSPFDTEEIPEHIFVSREEFEFRKSQGYFLAVETIKLNGEGSPTTTQFRW